MALLLMLFVGIANLHAQLPEELPNPNVGNPQNYVSDPNGMLSSSTKRHVNEVLDNLRHNTTAEMAVAVIRTTDDLPIEEYSYRLFKHWGIGKSDNNNGLLLVVAIDDRQAKIEVGSGAEGVITDMAADKVLRNALVPAMKEGNLNQAVANTVDDLYEAMTEADVAEELRSNRPEGAMSEVRAIDGDVIFSFIGVVAICVFLFVLAMFFIDFFSARKRDNYRRAMTWRPHLPIYWWGALFSCGLALPLALIARHLYRTSRFKPEICDSCGAKMKRLPEDEDNAYLSASQDFEEQLGTVDYDVWLCPECGTVERFPYVEEQLKYHKCPECNTIAMNLVMDKVVDEPTTTREGHGERIYQCQFCRHKRREGYRIPKKVDAAAAALAAGAVAGMMSGRNSGGNGGGFNGGFGGGHSSGGGATGRW